MTPKRRAEIEAHLHAAETIPGPGHVRVDLATEMLRDLWHALIEAEREREVLSIRWGSGLCSQHRVPVPECGICRPGPYTLAEIAEYNGWRARQDALHARVARYGEWCDVCDKPQWVLPTGEHVCQTFAELHARVTALEAALRRYGQHRHACATNETTGPPHWFVRTNPGPCDCGLDAALGPAGEGTQT
jgi:hypothetical protein